MNDAILRGFERLESARRRIEKRMDGVPPGALNGSPEPGRWSAVQIVAHVVLAEEKTVEYLRKKLSDPSRIRRAGFRERLSGRLVSLAMKLPVRVRAPEIVAGVPDAADPVELLARWARVRGDMRAVLESIPDALLGGCIYKHPVAGPMTIGAALEFMTAHATRHAKQLERVLEQAAGRPDGPAAPARH